MDTVSGANKTIERQKLNIADYIDFQAVTAALVQDPLLPQLHFAICNTDGRPLAEDPHGGICRDFHRKDAVAGKRCLESDVHLAQKIAQGETYAFHTCHNHLTEAATPITVEGEIIGFLKIGQVFLQPPDMRFFEDQAELYGFDKASYLEAAKQVPVMEEDKLREIMRYYAKLTSMIGALALQAYEYKMLSDKLKKRTEQLEYVNGELEAFTYSASHDLRAPLRHISGYIDLYNKKFGDQLTAQAAHYFSAIQDSARQMGRLIDDLLQFSRNGRVEMMKAEADMNAIVSECRNLVPKPCTETAWKIDSLPGTYGDPSMLKLVWFNLMDNAVKFTRHTENPRIEIGCCFIDGETVYYIRDNGVGFNMQYADKLFGVFQRMHSKEQFEGTGIGLATVKRIISRHGGKIWAHAQEQMGAAFYFTLPGKAKGND